MTKRMRAVQNDLAEVLFTEDEIAARVAEIGRAITRDYACTADEGGIVLISVLRGAAIFMADLARKIELPVEMDYLAVSSYGNGAKSSGVVRILKDLSSEIEGRHVIVAEDILDSGLTLKYLLKNLSSRNPASLEVATLLRKQTLAQALSGKHYGKIYLMLGINELGTGTAESWAAQYKVLLDEVRELQPDAIIFLQAIFHTTQEKSDATFFKNSTIDARNAELQKLADNETVFYIDCNPVFDDSTGALTPEYSGDGIHVKAAYYPMWRDYLFQFGVVK